ncbi:cysteine peptidase family C39 domain-containing protein, partial [Nodularia sp. UHCC 0506]|uniref:cysteine peptidase family C39 domain-containing protein n=1 Tax=Nodularia sp. UHCC 0506 TaxID=3110243 RepID=UPI002B210508
MKKNTSNQQSPTPAASILQLLQIVAGDTSLGADFSQAWMTREFQPGEDLNGDSEDTGNFLYVICQGQVRLWGFDATLGREVSTQLLLAAQTFGGEHLFCDQTLPYRAIAVSAGCVAQIAISDLKQWLHCIPNLESDLQLLTYQQQALLFFNTYIQWRSLTSATPEELLFYLIAIKITAGSSLLEATQPAQGRFWLAGGKIDNSLQIGDSWLYPDVRFNDGIAQTDLLVYYLSMEDWESVQGLGKLSAEIAREQSQTKQTHSAIIQIPLPVPQSIEPPQNEPEDISAVAKIDVPKWDNQPKLITNLGTKYPFIPQPNASDSGAACLTMISQYWGKRLGLYTLRKLAQVDRMGASFHGLAAAADNLGYDVLAVRASWDKLDTYTNPWIAEWQELHYVVVWHIKGDRLLISDPAIGKRWLSLAEFIENSTGYVLLLNPTKRFYTLKSNKVSLNRYWDLLRHYRKLLGQIIIASILVQVIGLATPLFTQVVIDQVMPLKDFDTLNIFVISFLGLGLWRTVLIAQRQYLLEYIANRIDIHLIGRFINYTLQLPLQFFASYQVEDIINRVQENSKIQLSLTRQAVSGSIDTLMVVIYLGLMAYYSWQLTLVVLLWMFLMVIISIVSSPFL